MFEELVRVVERLRARFRVHGVVLFGSRARGDWGPWSDYDVLIVADFAEPYLERIGVVLEVLSDVRLPIEPHPYTVEEVWAMLRRCNPLIIDALDEGVVLYSDDVFGEVLGRFAELRRLGIRRVGSSIEVGWVCGDG